MPVTGVCKSNWTGKLIKTGINNVKEATIKIYTSQRDFESLTVTKRCCNTDVF